MKRIEEIFFMPPMAVARLGASRTPLVSFTWLEDPSLHGAGLTIIAPATSLNVLADGSIRPFWPANVQFRDGDLLRPVAPFFELWARSGEEVKPITVQWLKENRSSLAAIQYEVTASNRKAARRTGDPACGFSAGIQVAGDNHDPQPLLASSLGEKPLVLPSKPIPLGQFQVIRPTPVRAMGVDLSVLRVRFTPASGKVYGPATTTPGRPITASDPDRGTDGLKHTVVQAEDRILNPEASWMQYSMNDRQANPEPADTYDGAGDSATRNRSIGVVDDTCDLIVRVTIKAGGKSWEATARAFTAPPDFAPDRRPFCSLAEELVDRDPPLREPAEDLPEAMDRLGDLFQRVYETASLANIDMTRRNMMPRDARDTVNFPGMAAVTLADSMTKKDPLFDPNEDLTSPPSSHEKLPLSAVASQTHAPLADTDDLASYLRENGDHVRKLIRPAYGHFKDLKAKTSSDRRPDPGQRDARILRDTEFDMRMPPYMRDSDATPLSLNRRQYEFMMQTLDRLQSQKAAKTPPLFSTQAHVDRVVRRVSTPGAQAKQDKAERKTTNPTATSRARNKKRK
jgi:hypothetical protein